MNGSGNVGWLLGVMGPVRMVFFCSRNFYLLHSRCGFARNVQQNGIGARDLNVSAREQSCCLTVKLKLDRKGERPARG